MRRGERRSANWTWGWGYVDVGLYAEQVKAYMDNFERVLLLLFEEDIVTGQATDKVLKFLNLDPFPKDLGKVHVNVSGYPQNRVLHRLMTDGQLGTDDGWIDALVLKHMCHKVHDTGC